jgi:hypothetical protein
MARNRTKEQHLLAVNLLEELGLDYISFGATSRRPISLPCLECPFNWEQRFTRENDEREGPG